MQITALLNVKIPLYICRNKKINKFETTSIPLVEKILECVVILKNCKSDMLLFEKLCLNFKLNMFKVCKKIQNDNVVRLNVSTVYKNGKKFLR